MEEDEKLPENHGIALVEAWAILTAAQEEENGVQIRFPIHDYRGKIEREVVHRTRESLDYRGEELEDGGNEADVELLGLHVGCDGKPGGSKRPRRTGFNE